MHEQRKTNLSNKIIDRFRTLSIKCISALLTCTLEGINVIKYADMMLALTRKQLDSFPLQLFVLSRILIHDKFYND